MRTDRSREGAGERERLGARTTRREFLAVAAGGAVAALATGREGRGRVLAGEDAPGHPVSDASGVAPPSARKLPRWRGFNLLEKFTLGGNKPYVERDFEWMARWGFDFVRLPTDYRCWTDPARPEVPDGERGEKSLREIDQAIELGKRHKIHVNMNLHRAPGYCVNPPKEPLDLWSDPKAAAAFAAQWGMLARRYKGIPSERLSFDLLNEPPDVKAEVYVRAARAAVEAIRAEDPARLIVVDGLKWGREPVGDLVDLAVAQSTRGYDPMRVSHHGASWVRGENWPEPSWPLVEGEGKVYDKERLRRERIEPWKALEAKGVGVHVGEWGAYQKCPRKVALAWMRDCLELWMEAGWGWALWNLRGSFGIVDSGRAETKYEDFEGHKLDREMLELLRSA
jgi:endoglucanase